MNRVFLRSSLQTCKSYKVFVDQIKVNGFKSDPRIFLHKEDFMLYSAKSRPLWTDLLQGYGGVSVYIRKSTLSDSSECYQHCKDCPKGFSHASYCLKAPNSLVTYAIFENFQIVHKNLLEQTIAFSLEDCLNKCFTMNLCKSFNYDDKG